MFGTSERILTTHAGSLPRPPDLLQMMYDRGAGKPVAGMVGPERVIAGTDCGFGTFAGWSACDPAVAWLKLPALVDGAGEASRALFGASVVPV